VAERLWDRGGDRGPWTSRPEVREAVERLQATLPADSLPLDRLKVTTVLLGALDPFRYDLSASSVVSVARTVAGAYVDSLPLQGTAAAAATIAERLWPRLTRERPTQREIALLSATLVLFADHGLGPSTRAVREAAATAADPYSALLAGMSVASGLLLGGGSSLAVQAWLGDIDSAASVSRVLGARLLRGDRLSGFGQPRYRGADPRAALLLRLLEEKPSRPDRWEIVRAAVDLVQERRRLHPNAEFALGALCFLHDMTHGAGEAIFAIARSAGWIVHAIEEYERGPHGPYGQDLR